MAIQKKKLIMEPSQPLVTLSDDLIFSILLRLPVKSLIRFSCVCKNWDSIIRSEAFLMLRFKPQKPRYLFSHFPHESPKPEKLWSFTKLSDSPFAVLPHLEPHFELVIGACNGLVCLRYNVDNNFELRLWNPTIRRYKILPSGSLLSRQSVLKTSDYFVEFVTIDLGFDSNINDYKVIVISCAYDALDLIQSRKHEAEIYSLSLDSWRKLEIVGVDHLVEVCHHSAFTNGAFHWLAKFISEEGVVYLSILRYNMFEERFEEIELPKDYPNELILVDRAIVVFRGLVAIFVRKHGTETCYIWTMNEGFWNKLEVEVPKSRCLWSWCRCVGDLVVMLEWDSRRICMFDPQTLQTKVVPITRPSSVHVYFESLALL